MCDEEMTGTGPVYGPPARRQQAKAKAALEQIRQVCADNASDTCNHVMALRFVADVARRNLDS